MGLTTEGIQVPLGLNVRPWNNALKRANQSHRRFTQGAVALNKRLRNQSISTFATVGKAGRLAFTGIAVAARTAGNVITAVFAKISGLFAPLLVTLAPLLGIIGAIATVKLATNFDTKMREINTIAELSSKELGKLKDNLLDVAINFGIAPVDVAAAQYQIFSASITDVNEAQEVLNQSLKLARAGLGNVNTTTKLLVGLLRAYEVEADQAAEFSDVLFTTVKRGLITIPELGVSLGRVAKLAKAGGLSIQELGAAMALLTKGGLQAEEAVTSLRAFITGLIKQSPEVRQKLKAMGLDISVAAIKAKGLVFVIDQLNAATKGELEAISEILPNIRGLIGGLGLAAKQGLSFKTELLLMKGALGSVDKAFAEIMAGPGGQFSKFLSGLKVGLILVGEIAAKTITNMFDDFGGIANVTKKVVAAIEFLGGIVNFTFSNIIAPAITTIFKIFEAGAEIFEEVFGDIFGEISGNFEEIKKTVGAAFDFIGREILTSIKDDIIPEIENFIAVIKDTINEFGGMENIVEKLKIGIKIFALTFVIVFKDIVIPVIKFVIKLITETISLFGKFAGMALKLPGISQTAFGKSLSEFAALADELIKPKTLAERAEETVKTPEPQRNFGGPLGLGFAVSPVFQRRVEAEEAAQGNVSNVTVNLSGVKGDLSSKAQIRQLGKEIVREIQRKSIPTAPVLGQ